MSPAACSFKLPSFCQCLHSLCSVSIMHPKSLPKRPSLTVKPTPTVSAAATPTPALIQFRPPARPPSLAARLALASQHAVARRQQFSGIASQLRERGLTPRSSAANLHAAIASSATGNGSDSESQWLQLAAPIAELLSHAATISPSTSVSSLHSHASSTASDATSLLSQTHPTQSAGRRVGWCHECNCLHTAERPCTVSMSDSSLIPIAISSTLATQSANSILQLEPSPQVYQSRRMIPIQRQPLTAEEKQSLQTLLNGDLEISGLSLKSHRPLAGSIRVQLSVGMLDIDQIHTSFELFAEACTSASFADTPNHDTTTHFVLTPQPSSSSPLECPPLASRCAPSMCAAWRPNRLIASAIFWARPNRSHRA